VALGPNEDFVAVVESSGLRVLRKWLKGPDRGPRGTHAWVGGSDGHSVAWVVVLVKRGPTEGRRVIRCDGGDR